MKFVKRISLFFILSMGMYALGFYSHMRMQEEFYPGRSEAELEHQAQQPEEEGSGISREMQVIPTALEEEQTIHADTRYIIEEVDLKRNTAVETSWKIPDKYIGMDRQAFVKEMELYQLSPSLKDQELGFVSVEVISFSREKVAIRKSYIYEEACTSFYLVNQQNCVVVYCDDLKTVYMNTNIMLDSLPDELKQEIIQKKYVATEEELYNFLESYSS
ncbi:MAG: hypothetical protein MR430_07800 [Lachnospiraceae bacterium]|nr:hypothetical protein [Lachnospiraceae bacterium]